MHILLIEDDPEVATAIHRTLTRAEFTVDHVADGSNGLQRALDMAPDLILLDLLLPGLDGWSVCQRLRLRGMTTPILILSGLGSVEDRVHGLEVGADDYLVKPFAHSELVARIRALLRRTHAHKGAVIQIGDLEIQRDFRMVKRSGREIRLTHKEYVLLEALAVNEGRILSHDFIQGHVWNDHEKENYSNTVGTFIKQLRKKVDPDPLPKLIHTIHGMGYTLRRPEAPSL